MTEIRLDAKTLRALAHPLRIRLLGLLRAEGPATATGLAQRVGESSGTTSWHLRQLADHGFIEQDTERGNKRERWWKAAYESTGLRMEDFRGDEESAGALSAYLYEIASGDYRRMTTFLAEDWGQEWRESFVMSDQNLPLTPDELKAMRTELHEVVDRYRRPERRGDEIVVAQIQAFPRKRRPE
ncbi:winged helix-turn-helix domain-containing protein [Kutzneria sp. CA-103260]|uniref:winged helix-turn-helix domain-containing protein n=1 Tax=Kutzneria sp. CA-103260 TaxID=2802641 RepID=UPI001BA63C91|nr:helix-turn-helix domain-containing protein [Kutzneria sp. CA-103260]QUQ65006.1 ArsR family transcriptional regulator [Kutzneria sp. CA-103260]